MDREKVFKGIRKCLSHKPCSENGCPYENECAVEHLNDPLLRDAIELLKKQQEQIDRLLEESASNAEMEEGLRELLKEQEAVEPTLIREGRNKHYNDYVCPRCDNEVVYEQNYCSECGIPFLWKGRGSE